jgi:hypothetical protein
MKEQPQISMPKILSNPSTELCTKETIDARSAKTFLHQKIFPRIISSGLAYP